MSENPKDPAANTQQFQAFVSGGQAEPVAEQSSSRVGLIVIIAGTVLVLAVLAAFLVF